ncbi:hypothetical protein [Brevibacillus formosus]|uniref:hypothetical protein n=1 Tax=Brevibacillus formosus TaxID=54913 RepID=UPI001F3AC296|nr:hypothetical protein [Brevibacillus formosus]
MVVAEVAASVFSAGTGTAVMRTVKTADKLNGPDGKKKSGDQEGNGKGVLLPDSDIDDAMSAMLKDGKLKTHGKSFAKSMIELQKAVEKLLEQMANVFNGRVVVLRNAATGQTMIYWMRHDDLPGGNRRRSDEDDEGPDNYAKIPRTGPEWDEYFRSRYGDDNVDWKTSSEYKLYGPYHIPYTPKIRPNAIKTSPSLPKGGKPEGEYPVEKRPELIEFLKSQTHKELKHLNELLIIEDRQVTRAYWRFE